MATARPELNSVDGVLNFYDLQGDDRPRFIIYAGHRISPDNCRYEYNGEDKNTGSSELLAMCNAILSNPSNSNVYILQVLAEPIKPGKKQTVANRNDSRSITFQLNNPMQYGQPLPYIAGASRSDADHREEMKILLERIEELENQESEEGEPKQPTPTEMIMIFIGGLLAQPKVQDAIVGKILSVFDGEPKADAGAKVAGISKGEFILTDGMKQSLTVLNKVVPDLPGALLKLEKMALNNPNQLKTLLNFL